MSHTWLGQFIGTLSLVTWFLINEKESIFNEEHPMNEDADC